MRLTLLTIILFTSSLLKSQTSNDFYNIIDKVDEKIEGKPDYIVNVLEELANEWNL